jgi:hypothetical protein
MSPESTTLLAIRAALEAERAIHFDREAHVYKNQRQLSRKFGEAGVLPERGEAGVRCLPIRQVESRPTPIGRRPPSGDHPDRVSQSDRATVPIVMVGPP